ncbi:hypothetical protein A7U60_g2798 [Sanghuangporus baumii]|uniref:Uncharacterized protein n=1 Tax=Sanghuangporus baumii TaxID=108892 RepID=A0A9Q5I220_SANBA|nr:hypothetical protein A7U60_g2798 [Sanghuangporus baumii]
MLALAYSLKQNAQRLSLAKRIILTPKSNFRPSQIIQNQHVFVKHISTQFAPQSFLQFRARTAQKHANLPDLTICSTRRCYATVPSAATGGLRKFRRFFGILLKVTTAVCLLSVAWAISELWTSLHSPELSTWPESLRLPLISARIAQAAGKDEELVDILTKVWKTLQDTPVDALSPDPPIKMLGIAMWFADALEKDHQSIKAYRLLEQAIQLYQTRFQKSPLPNGKFICKSDATCEEFSVVAADSLSDNQVDTHSELEIMGRRHLISAFLKLSSLSEMVEPKAEGKWLTRAIRESIRLLPSCKDVNVLNYARLISDAEEFASHDASFTGLSTELSAQIESKEDPPVMTEVDKDTSISSVITMDEDTKSEDALPLLRWHVRDVISAIAVPLERIGMYAEKHGRPDIALRSYTAACDMLKSILATRKLEDVTLAYWTDIVHLLRIVNRHMDLHLRQLESEVHAVEWLYRLHVISRDSRLCNDIMGKSQQILEVNGSDWKLILSRKYEIIFELMFEYGISLRLAGDAPDTRREAKQIQAFMAVAKMEELGKLEQAMKAVKQSIAEGKTSIQSHMNAMALKEWEEMVRQRTKEDEPTTHQN